MSARKGEEATLASPTNRAREREKTLVTHDFIRGKITSAATIHF